jgi:transforming growth factor-beta-induced protein
MKTLRILMTFLTLFGLLAFALPVGAESTIVDLAVADGRFTTLVAAVQAAGLVDTLKSKGPFTVFAPTDDAFKKLPAGTVEGLLKDIPTLKNILLYHVVSGDVRAADVVKLSSANTVLGKPVTIKVEGDKVKVNDAMVIITDIVASNGVIHVIDTVLLPPADLAAGPTYAVRSGDSLSAIAGRTLGNWRRYTEIVELTNRMAESDKSYRAIGNPNLIYPGQKLVLPEGAQVQTKDIVDIAVADGRFTTLVAAVQAAGLVDTLKSAGPFTVFAPTDDAFKKLPAGTVEGLLKDIPTLKNILLYHVVSGDVRAADVVKLTSANTALGKPVTIKVDGDKVMVNDAAVIITDIVAANGVIHVIDTVLLPPQ